MAPPTSSLWYSRTLKKAVRAVISYKKFSWYSRDWIKVKCMSSWQSVHCGYFDYCKYLLYDRANLRKTYSSHKLHYVQIAEFHHVAKNLCRLLLYLHSSWCDRNPHSAHREVYGYCVHCGVLPHRREGMYSSQKLRKAQTAAETRT